MQYKKTDPRGSFVACGIAFDYKYSTDERILNVTRAGKDKPLLFVDFDRSLSKAPELYVESLEKATQVNALMFSNNETVDLSKIFDDIKLTAILENSTYLARYSFDLKRGRFDLFARNFCQDFSLKKIKIREISGLDPDTAFYIAKLKTLSNNSISARSESLPGTIRNLSETTISDLMTVEYGHDYEKSAQNLLVVSAKLAKISCILNKNFIPTQKIRANQTDDISRKA